MKKRIAYLLVVVIGFYTGTGYADDESEECLQAMERFEQIDDLEELSERNCRFLISYSRDPSDYGCTWGDPDYAKPSLEFLAGLWEGNCRLAGHFPFSDQDTDSTKGEEENPNPRPNPQGPTAPNPPAEGGASGNCEGVADGEYIPTVPQPIDAYLGLASTGYTLYSVIVSTTNLVESQKQAIETGDSSELFDNVYGILWSIVVPIGDVIGMRDIFSDFSQLADDLASGGNC